MQHRMKTHQLTNAEAKNLLAECLTGTLATINPDGTPYNVPVHYLFRDSAIYVHGLPAGQKIRNLKANPNICFNVYKMRGLYLTRTKNRAIPIRPMPVLSFVGQHRSLRIWMRRKLHCQRLFRSTHRIWRKKKCHPIC